MYSSANVQSFSKDITNIAKGVAILLMIAHHLFYSVESLDALGFQLVFPLLSEEHIVLLSNKIGKVCVSMFILLTGYGMTVSYNKKEKLLGKSLNKEEKFRFVLQRYISLEGNFLFIYIFVALATCFVTVTPVLIYGQYGNVIVNAVIDALGLATGFNTPTINGTWWYMTLAFVVVITMPISIAMTKKFGLLCIIFFMFVLPFSGFQQEFLICYFPAMFMGIYMADNGTFERWSAYKPLKKQNNTVNKLFKR